MTIEEKLSAIKAINDEISVVDNLIRQLNKEPTSLRVSLGFEQMNLSPFFAAVLLHAADLRKDDLISKAEALMKSED